MIIRKKCRSCCKDLNINRFYKTVGTKGGIFYRCKSCCKKKVRTSTDASKAYNEGVRKSNGPMNSNIINNSASDSVKKMHKIYMDEKYAKMKPNEEIKSSIEIIEERKRKILEMNN